MPSGAETFRPVRHLFLFIGADPNTTWLSESNVALDPKGFVRTGADLAVDRRALETSRDGVFAIGDVRSGSTKRVAAAVGEGAQVIATIHTFLSDVGERMAITADDGRVPLLRFWQARPWAHRHPKAVPQRTGAESAIDLAWAREREPAIGATTASAW